MTGFCRIRNSDPNDVPILHTLHSGNTTIDGESANYFMIWRGGKVTKASAWTASTQYYDDGDDNRKTVHNDNHKEQNDNPDGMIVNIIEGPGWVPPPSKPDSSIMTIKTVRGDHVAFTSWFEGRFGHYADDHLPTIAYLKHHVPTSTRFLLHDNPLSRSVLSFLDPSFYDRVTWIQLGDIVRIDDGSLMVAVPHKIPLMWGCLRPYQYLRHWIQQQHPSTTVSGPVVDRNDDDNNNNIRHGKQQKNLVVYYSRNAAAAKHGRSIERSLEKQILELIRVTMDNYGHENDELVIFDGTDPITGETMSVEEQFRLFRHAHTVIGPHGAGILGNLLWVDPVSVFSN